MHTSLLQLREKLTEHESGFTAAKQALIAANYNDLGGLALISWGMIDEFCFFVQNDSLLNKLYKIVSCQNERIHDLVSRGVTFTDLFNIVPRHIGDHYYPYTVVSEVDAKNFSVNLGYMEYDAIRDVLGRATEFKDLEGLTWMSTMFSGNFSEQETTITDRMITFIINLYTKGIYFRKDSQIRGWWDFGGKHVQKLRRSMYTSVHGN